MIRLDAVRFANKIMLFILEPDGMHALKRRKSLALVKHLGRSPETIGIRNR